MSGLPYSAMAAIYDEYMADADLEAWTDYVDREITGVLGRRPKTLCDAACGTGRAALHFAKAGIQTVGMDTSLQMLALAAEKARKDGLSVHLVQQNLTAMLLHRPVEAITCLCDGLNYLLKEDELSRFFAAAYQNLVPGGVLVFDLSSPYKLEHVLAHHTFAETKDASAYIWENHFENGLLHFIFTLFQEAADGCYIRSEESHIQAAHTPEQITTLLARHGFEIVHLHGDSRATPPSPVCERHYYTAKKR